MNGGVGEGQGGFGEREGVGGGMIRVGWRWAMNWILRERLKSKANLVMEERMASIGANLALLQGGFERREKNGQGRDERRWL